ncbi:MAG: helix-turn-helix domain-containing protein, partial [Clostridia bacterium]|nr:helix-turn-helix domain-containing protein [Clostridia bacterium]
GYTQQDVADKLNISDRTLSSWETGRTEPDLSSLAALADFYGLTVDEILRGERKSGASEFKEETAEQEPTLTERFAKLLSGLKKLTALGLACAALVLTGFILLLYVPAPMWVDFTLVFAGAIGNVVCIAFIYSITNKALLSVPDEEKSAKLALKHSAAICVIINSLAYIAWVIVLLMCYWFVSGFDMNPTGTVYENYDLYSAAAVIICFVLGGGLLIFAVSTNLANVNCLGNERQKSAVKANVKTFKIISVFGGGILTLCLITYTVFCHVNFTETDVYFTAKGVDEVYKTLQTYSRKESQSTYRNSDGDLLITVIPEGEYYLDFQSETYVEATAVYYELFPRTVRFYSLGNNFYAHQSSG